MQGLEIHGGRMIRRAETVTAVVRSSAQHTADLGRESGDPILGAVWIYVPAGLPAWL